MGGVPWHCPGEPHGQAHLVHRQLQPSQKVGAVTVVGPLARGYHRKAPAVVGVALRYVGPLGPLEVALRPNPWCTNSLATATCHECSNQRSPMQPSLHRPHSDSV